MATLTPNGLFSNRMNLITIYLGEWAITKCQVRRVRQMLPNMGVLLALRTGVCVIQRCDLTYSAGMPLMLLRLQKRRIAQMAYPLLPLADLKPCSSKVW